MNCTEHKHGAGALSIPRRLPSTITLRRSRSSQIIEKNQPASIMNTTTPSTEEYNHAIERTAGVQGEPRRKRVRVRERYFCNEFIGTILEAENMKEGIRPWEKNDNNEHILPNSVKKFGQRGPSRNLLSEAYGGKSEIAMAQASLSAILDDNKANKNTRTLQSRQVDDFARKA